jgi:hypothetical protein
VGNLEAVELGLRQALLKDGRLLLEQLLQQADLSVPDNTTSWNPADDRIAVTAECFAKYRLAEFSDTTPFTAPSDSVFFPNPAR